MTYVVHVLSKYLVDPIFSKEFTDKNDAQSFRSFLASLAGRHEITLTKAENGIDATVFIHADDIRSIVAVEKQSSPNLTV